MKKIAPVLSLLAAAALLLTSCGPAAPAENEPYLITGSMDYTNEFISYIFEEHMVALVDMYGFVMRDEEWEIPVASQALGYMDMDESAMHAEYTLLLPKRPTGQFVDVDNNGKADAGVQIFAVSYWPNVYGGPFSEGDDRSRGWPAGFSSNKTDPERNDEVNGGKLVVWAPDGKQSFPTGYGADNLLFTADDPVAPIPAGWTIVDLDQTPFAFLREATPSVTLYEPSDYAVKDYSGDTYTEAFDKLVAFLRINYAFNGIQGKEPDYDALVAAIRPRVEQAEARKDAEAFYLALRDFTWAFHDGHVGMSGGDFQSKLFTEATAGGYGFAIQQLDDGRYVVMYVRDPGPAKDAGIAVGAEVTAFNGRPIAEAVAAVTPWALPQSTEWQVRYQQARYLLRARPGDQATVTFVNPGGEPQTATLTAIGERDSFSRTSIYYGAPENLLPVEFRILPSGVGYVAVYSEADDIQLTIKLFERALKSFQEAEAPGIIIDMRYNGGGTPLGLAGFLTDQEIPLGQSYYYNENTGRFEPEGTMDKILPNQNQYRFDKIVVLVGPACASACEEESYGFSRVPGAEVVGMFPTASMFGEVSRGQFIMPEGFSMQFPTGRYLLPDGSLFLEGTGVQPTLRVPITLETVTADYDIILQYGERAVLLPLGAGITPSGPPTVVGGASARGYLSSADLLQDLARENYSEEVFEPHTLTYTVPLRDPKAALMGYIWCATSAQILRQNFELMEFRFVVDGQEVPDKQLATYDFESGGYSCRIVYVALTKWPAGEHRLSLTTTFTAIINDGMNDYAPGDYIQEYTVYVKP